jgi:hypothetical protein
VKHQFIAIVSLLSLTLAKAQELHPYYLLEPISSSKRIHFNLTSKSGNCYILSNSDTQAVKILGVTENDAATSSFWSELVDDTKLVKVDLRHKNQTSSSGWLVTQSFFGSSQSEDRWHVYLSKDHPLALDLHYMVGSAFVDLSDLLLERVKINSASANVYISNKQQVPNAIEMDTFLVKVDFGSIKMTDLHLANVSNVYATIGFGNLTLDLQRQWDRYGTINASVAAGSMDILLPMQAMPMKLILNDSPLCSVKIPSGFRQISKNVYVSENYTEGIDNLLTVNLEVGMGSITFRQR